mgnify:FL=1|jgi:hypothetical protein
MKKIMKPKKPNSGMVAALTGTTNGKPKKKGGYAG